MTAEYLGWVRDDGNGSLPDTDCALTSGDGREKRYSIFRTQGEGGGKKRWMVAMAMPCIVTVRCAFVTSERSRVSGMRRGVRGKEEEVEKRDNKQRVDGE